MVALLAAAAEAAGEPDYGKTVTIIVLILVGVYLINVLRDL